MGERVQGIRYTTGYWHDIIGAANSRKMEMNNEQRLHRRGNKKITPKTRSACMYRTSLTCAVESDGVGGAEETGDKFDLLLET